MHLRRALLLFAIVLGLAAVVASVSRPGEEVANRPETAPRVSEPEPGARPPRELFFYSAVRRTGRLAPGEAATVLVSVEEPCQVEIEGMGQTTTAQPLAPARFEILTDEAGRYPIYVTPASGDERIRTGTLVVTSPDR